LKAGAFRANHPQAARAATCRAASSSATGREDSAGFARLIYDRLTHKLGHESVFFDVDNIAPGLDFVDILSERVGKCDALIAVIGKTWVSSAYVHDQRRLDDPNDFVRIEIEAALERKIRVIPVLVDGAPMPRLDDLPDSLKKFTRRQGIEVSHSRFDSDVDRLTRALSLLDEELRQREAAEQARQAAEIEAARRATEERRAREAAEAERAAREEGEKQQAAENAARERPLVKAETAQAAGEVIKVAAKSASDAAKIATEPTRGEAPAALALRRAGANRLVLAAVASVAIVGAAALIAENHGRQLNTRELQLSMATAPARDTVTPAPAVTPTPKAVAQPESAATPITPEAQYEMGFKYNFGLGGVSQDYQQAAYWYRRAADQGYSDAQFMLGALYENGLGVNRDYGQAKAWYQKAADQGDEYAKVAMRRLQGK
jgi:TPR repeat protein